ncbi:DnaJ domain-containing protein [Novosphingobium sp.]|uniref:DnaJ domain-containing protein n=1 Tax=Novosphingobium sp. TaxID=1874826 RepID=UPI00286A6657|nr:DnaJ domain-containing protein [Novosphingobium sp.]
MSESEQFVDYYAMLRVIPTCDPRTLETAYHALAKKYHPDHAETADVAKLTEVIDAYKILRDPGSRAEYDLVYARTTGFLFSEAGDGLSEERAAMSDAEAHAKVLHYLYKKRRDAARDAGVGQFTVHEMLGCSDELFDFHLWYLREKGFIQTTEQGTLAITIEGVDHVIATSRTVLKEKLMIAQSGESAEI